MDFGANLKKLRKEKNVTQQQLADVLCVDKTSISKWENGFNYPNQNIQLMIADYFGVTVDYLLGRDDTPSPDKRIRPRCNRAI
jgi:transcriptional regulator with XRE-family HTH domain